MGYRLNSAACQLVEALAKNFTVITFDNRVTGLRLLQRQAREVALQALGEEVELALFAKLEVLAREHGALPGMRGP